MFWLIAAIIANALAAINFIIDKFILRQSIREPIVYTFWVGIMSILALVIFPFELILPGVNQLLIALLTGFFFLGALYSLFTVLAHKEASRVVPIVGALTPIFITLINYILRRGGLENKEMLAFCFLVLGSLVISFKSRHRDGDVYETDFYSKDMSLMLLSSLLFGFFYVFTEIVYEHEPFLSGFAWIRVGMFFAAMFLLILPKNRKTIFSSSNRIRAKQGGLVVFNKFIAGIASILLNYAIFWGGAALVNAMQGTQYVFLFIFTLILSQKYSWIIQEKISFWIVLQKTLAVVCIGIGLMILFKEKMLFDKFF